MATMLENLKWQLYKKRRQILMDYGIEKGLIHPYEVDFIETLRNTYFGGVPASIILLSHQLTSGRCYDMALLACFGMGDDDFKMVDANIDGLALNPVYIDEYNKILSKFGKVIGNYKNHCFVERTKQDGTVWVYDTTIGFVCEKNLYYKMENPEITKINEKHSVLDYFEYQDIKNADIEKDKYILPITIPNIEMIASVDDGMYKDILKYEIELFKEKIGYDDIVREVEEDMKEKDEMSGEELYDWSKRFVKKTTD